MGMIKKVIGMVVGTAISTVTACKVVDLYNKYVHDNIARDNLKRKIRQLNPFKNKD